MSDRVLHFFARLFAMSDETWERHASPWSVWTRFATFPFILAALWSVHWIGWWAALPIGAIVVWLAVNPRLFPPPAHTTSWASRAVMGERIYLSRGADPIPGHHSRVTRILTVAALAATAIMLGGLVFREPAMFLSGATASILLKLWFVDRMVWLYDEMSRRVPRYAAWLR